MSPAAADPVAIRKQDRCSSRLQLGEPESFCRANRYSVPAEHRENQPQERIPTADMLGSSRVFSHNGF